MESFKDLLEKLRRDSEEVKQALPKLLAMEKQRFLIAIGKSEPKEWTKEDEELKKDITSKLESPWFSFNCDRQLNLKWNDSFVLSCQILQKDQQFDKNVYLNCVKWIYLAYLGLISTAKLGQAFSYVLCHARCFGNPSKRVFQFTETDPTLPEIPTDVTTKELITDTKYMQTISELIVSLKTSFSEDKFQRLNVNVTYLVSLVLRRSVRGDKEFSNALARGETHENYVNLCPLHVDTRLPIIAEKTNREFEASQIKDATLLLISAYLNCKDYKTTRVLKSTSIQYMDGNGLGLPKLFFKVVDLYKIEEGVLWDTLASLGAKQICKSLLLLADVYNYQYQKSKSDPTNTFRWFYFCRLVNSEFHTKLAAKDNFYVCYILAFLVDLILGLDKSWARCAQWTKSYTIQKEASEKAARQIHKVLTNGSASSSCT